MSVYFSGKSKVYIVDQVECDICKKDIYKVGFLLSCWKVKEKKKSQKIVNLKSFLVCDKCFQSQQVKDQLMRANEKEIKTVCVIHNYKEILNKYPDAMPVIIEKPNMRIGTINESFIIAEQKDNSFVVDRTKHSNKTMLSISKSSDLKIGVDVSEIDNNIDVDKFLLEQQQAKPILPENFQGLTYNIDPLKDAEKKAEQIRQTLKNIEFGKEEKISLLNSIGG